MTAWRSTRIPLCLLVALSLFCHAAELNLMPWPAQIRQQPGSLSLDRAPVFKIVGGDKRVSFAVAHFKEQLSLRTGVPFDPEKARVAGVPVILIRCSGPGQKVQKLGEDESYQLVVEDLGVELTAANPLGILRGLETLLQLVHAGEHGWEISAVQIEDHPRFPWRGLMIDISRHFMPVDVLKRNIDGMAAVKLNVLHLHLSDDEGFRVESRRAPRLQKFASNQLFYSQPQIRDLISYARERGIRVVPEFDVPAHAVSWLVAYPKLSSAGTPDRLVRGMADSERPTLDPTLSATYRLLDSVFGEMAGLFPDQYFHIGGDEVNGKYWDQNERIQTWMRTRRIKDNHALQAYFNRRVQAILAKHSKRMEGWDEILAPELPTNTLVQSWRGPQTLASAARMGFQTLLSAGWYLDLMFPASQHYAVEPFSGESESLSPEEKARIVGGEAAQWTEYVTPEVLDNRLWPRLGAIAERLWSPQSVTEVDSMYRRLKILNRNLEWLDLRQRTNSQRMLDRIAGDAPLDLLETLSVQVEPVKEYDREKTQGYDVTRPLNRLVDAVSPESDTAREISALIRRAIQDPAQRPQLRKWFALWRDNDAQLTPFLNSSGMLAELGPLSHSLSALGSVGLQALESIESGSPIKPEVRSLQLVAINDAALPHAELLIPVAPAIRQLVEAEPVAQ
jgi:hexosaminidase